MKEHKDGDVVGGAECAGMRRRSRVTTSPSARTAKAFSLQGTRHSTLDLVHGPGSSPGHPPPAMVAKRPTGQKERNR